MAGQNFFKFFAGKLCLKPSKFLLFLSLSGTLKPNERKQIAVSFSPTLLEDQITKSYELAKQEILESKKKTPISSKSSRRSRPESRVSSRGSRSRAPSPEDPKSTDLYWKIRGELIRNFLQKNEKMKIPCFVTSDEISAGNNYRKANFSHDYCLWLNLNLTIQKPKILAKASKMNVKFEPTPLKQTQKLFLEIENISDEKLRLSGSLLHPKGLDFYKVLNEVDFLFSFKH